MGDLMAFYGTTAGGLIAAAPIAVQTERMQIGDTVLYIEIDKGMVAKIWVLQLEGTNTGKVTLQYTTDGGVTWNDLKGFNKDSAVAERFRYTARPIVVEAWNDGTWIRFLEEIVPVTGADIDLTADIEFARLEKQ